jgi:hypothetical protein
MSTRTTARDALITLLTENTTFAAANLVPYKGQRKSNPAKGGGVNVLVRVGSADYSTETKGGAGVSRVRQEFELEVVIDHGAPLVSAESAPTDGALEDSLDGWVDVVRGVVENNQALTGTVYLASVTGHEQDTDQDNEDDFGTATVTVRCLAFHTQGA